MRNAKVPNKCSRAYLEKESALSVFVLWGQLRIPMDLRSKSDPAFAVDWLFMAVSCHSLHPTKDVSSGVTKSIACLDSTFVGSGVKLF